MSLLHSVSANTLSLSWPGISLWSRLLLPRPGAARAAGRALLDGEAIAVDYDPAMGRFIAEVVFTVELEDINQGGRRLHELSNAASALGFEMQRGQVREDDAPAPSPDGWTAYAPE